MTQSARAVAKPLLVVGVVVALVCVVGFSAPVAGQSATDAEAGQSTTDAETGNASFGAQISSFMQSTAAEANDTVDDGMWRAEVDDTDSPNASVSQRAERLRDRLTSLENRTETLSAGQDGPPGLVYTARASAVRARIATLQKSIDETAQVARDNGVDDATLATLRDRANDVNGPSVPGVARNLTTPDRGQPANATPGPDGERGPPDEQSEATSGNGGRTGPGEQGQAGRPDDSGPPDGPGAASGDGAPPENGNSARSGSGDDGPPENGGARAAPTKTEVRAVHPATGTAVAPRRTVTSGRQERSRAVAAHRTLRT